MFASFQPEDINQWVGIALSRCVRDLSIGNSSLCNKPDVLLPTSLYTCDTLVTLKLEGKNIVVDPPTVSLPSLKTLQLDWVTYSNDDSLRLLLSRCPVLEDLVTDRYENDNLRAVIVMVPSLQRLSLRIDDSSPSDVYVIVSPSLKYFKVEENRCDFSYLIERMPKLEEADIDVQRDLEKLLSSVVSVKRFSLRVFLNNREESLYRAGIVFNQLEHLTLCIDGDYWSKLLIRLLKDSPNLQILNVYKFPNFKEYERISWDNKHSPVPKCLLNSLETFEFTGYRGRPEERDFLSFLFKNACCLKSSLIILNYGLAKQQGKTPSLVNGNSINLGVCKDMDRISELSEDLLVKILSFLPTKVAVSTSILSKRWKFLWMWLPKLEYNDSTGINRSKSSFLRYLEFIDKNLPLHRAPVIESLCLRFYCRGLLQPENIKLWVGIDVSRCVRELSIDYFSFEPKPDILFPSSLYTCNSLMTLKLSGSDILVDVPGTVCLPSLKTVHLQDVTYSYEDSLQLLLSSCPVLEDLVIERDTTEDNVKALVVTVPSLQRLSLRLNLCSDHGYVIATPSLKYFKVENYGRGFSYLIEHMPKLEEAYIDVQQDLEKLLSSVISVKHLSLCVFFNHRKESWFLSRAGIVFSQLENLKLCIGGDYWSKFLVRLLKDSPKLRVLNLYASSSHFEEYERNCWDNKLSSVPKCLLNSLETFKFEAYKGREEERDFLSFLFKNVPRLKSSSILDMLSSTMDI